MYLGCRPNHVEAQTTKFISQTAAAEQLNDMFTLKTDTSF